LNFTVPKDMTAPKVGGYAQVRVVQSHPNSLVGEMVSATEAQGQAVYGVI
jgi:hypothetical protein